MSIPTSFITTTSISTSTLTTTLVVYWAEPSGTFTTSYTSVETVTTVLPPVEGAFGPRVQDVAIAGTVFAVLFFIAFCVGIGLCYNRYHQNHCRKQDDQATESAPSADRQQTSTIAQISHGITGAVTALVSTTPPPRQSRRSLSASPPTEDQNNTSTSPINPVIPKTEESI
jgi:hypothetical protein